jgi:hypothetical protein
MKKAFLLTLLVTFTTCSYSQIAKDFMIGASADLVRSDYNELFRKLQLGVEANYFISRKFTATAGLEYWTSGPQASVVMGARYFPIREAFVRVRGLIGANDVAIGGGWTKPLNEDWKFEAMADYYFVGDVGIRVGFAYIIRRKHESD